MRPEKKKDAALNDGEKRKWVGIDRRRNEEVKAIKKVMKEVINRESSGRETPQKKDGEQNYLVNNKEKQLCQPNA